MGWGGSCLSHVKRATKHEIGIYSFTLLCIRPLAFHVILTDQYKVVIPISVPSFSMVLIRHRMLHFMGAVGLIMWRTGVLCEWERSILFTPCSDIWVWELVLTHGGHSCLINHCGDWCVFGEQHAGYEMVWVRNQEQQYFFSYREQVFLNNKTDQINGSLCVFRNGDIFTEN